MHAFFQIFFETFTYSFFFKAQEVKVTFRNYTKQSEYIDSGFLIYYIYTVYDSDRDYRVLNTESSEIDITIDTSGGKEA